MRVIMILSGVDIYSMSLVWRGLVHLRTLRIAECIHVIYVIRPNTLLNLLLVLEILGLVQKIIIVINMNYLNYLLGTRGMCSLPSI